MAASAASQRLERIEKFLDNSDKVDTPANLQEPFRSLFLRIMGEKPTMMSDERKETVLTGGFSAGGLGDVQITAGGSDKGSIELISPKDVGPTIEMEVKEEKVTFKMAGEKDLKKVQARENAANQMISLQSSIKPISGLGGEVAKVWEGITDIARDYKEGNYEKAIDIGKVLEKKIKTTDFKRSIIVELQKKLSEYETIGGNLTKAKAKFKELAEALKEDADDLILIAGDVNALAEASIRDIVVEEVVAVKAAPEPKEKKPKVLKRKIIPELPKETKEKPPEEPKEKEPSSEDEFEIDENNLEEVEAPKEEEEKPVIKIVTVKKLVPVKKMKKERAEYEKSKKMAEEQKDQPTAVKEKEPEPVKQPELEPELESEPVKKPKPEPEPVKEDKPPAEEKPRAAVDGTPNEQITEAFKKYQTAYTISLKMHEKGKDVSTIFDLMKFAEQSREKGDMKTYIGVCNQMESMVLKMQTQ